jgi:hypothetical protein
MAPSCTTVLPKWSDPFRFSHWILVYISHLSYPCVQVAPISSLFYGTVVSIYDSYLNLEVYVYSLRKEIKSALILHCGVGIAQSV